MSLKSLIDRRCLLLGAFLVQLLLQLYIPDLATAKSDGVEIRAAAAKLTETEPGKIISASFVVANHTSQDEELTEQLTLPTGWQKLAPPDLPFTVQAGSQSVRIVAVAIPALAPSGRFDVKYAVYGQPDRSLGDTVSFSAVVLPVSKLELTVEETPDMVIAGEPYIVRLRLVNHGNAKLSIHTATKSTPNFPVKTDGTELALEPGGSRDITLKVATDGGLAEKVAHVLSIESAAAASGGQAVSAKQTVVTNIIPRISGNQDPYVRAPITYRHYFTQQTGRKGTMQAELSGGGALNEEGTRSFEFLFRGPDAQQTSNSFELRDEYRVSYFGEDFDIHLGDRTYTLSPLTERYGYGRGAEMDYHSDAFGAGAYYMQSRWRASNPREIGSYVKYDFGRSFELKLNFLRKWDAETLRPFEAISQNLWTLESHYKPGKWLDLALEGGFSQSDHGNGLNPAWRIEARGELPHQVYYSLEATHAAPSFFGAVHDSDATRATLTFPIFQKLSGNLAYDDYTTIAALNPIESTVLPHENSWRGGLRYRFSTITDASAEYRYIHREDVLLPAAFDFTENSVRLGLRHNFGKFALQNFLDIGEIRDMLRGNEDRFFERYSVFLNYRTSANYTYSLFGSYGPSPYIGETGNNWSFGATGSWKVRESMGVNVQYSRNGYDSLSGRTQDSLQASLNYTFANRQSFSMATRWSHTNGQKEPEAAVLVSYTVPLSLPVGRKTSTGAIKGQVFEPSGLAAMPIPRAVVFANDTAAVSDENGDFVFPSLKPGIYTLRLDQRSIGTERIALQEFPQTIEVKRDSAGRLSIGVVNACAISVRVVIFAPPAANRLSDIHPSEPQPPMKEVGGLAAAVVEISNGRQIIRQETDSDGNAAFNHLQPGKWALKVRADELPPNTVLEQPETQLMLEPAQTQSVTVRLLSRRRTVTFIDEGTIR